MKPRNLPITNWDMNILNPDHYLEGYVDVYLDEDSALGERVICIFRKKDIPKFEDPECYDFTVAILCNNCGVKSGLRNLLGLNAGQIVPVQFNGEFNPTIPLEWITMQFWKM